MAITQTLNACPHCNVNHIQVLITSSSDWGSESVYFIAHCLNAKCKKPIFFIRERLKRQNIHSNELGEIRFLYPFMGEAILDASPLPDRVPEEFKEAVTCMAVGALLSSMTMARRVLQRCLKNKGHNHHKLVEQIKSAKADGTIPKRYHEVADEIRLYGNIGAHPDDDVIGCVTMENCHQLIEFTRLIIEELYVLPQKAELLRKNRTGN